MSIVTNTTTIFKEEEEAAEIRDKILTEKFPPKQDYYEVKEKVDNLVEGNLFYRELCKHRIIDEDGKTLYCIRMWFGSGLDFFQWKLLREDVTLNIDSPISASVPYNKYRHILVFDPSLITESVREEIYHMCHERHIYPLPLNLIRVLPYFWKPYYCFNKAKDRLQCLFAYYLNHVALFDFDVRLKSPIHDMLLPSSYCYTSNEGMDAFVSTDNTRLKGLNLEFSLRNYSFGVVVVESIDGYVVRCGSGHRRNEVGRSLFFSTSQRTDTLKDIASKEFRGECYESISEANIHRLEKLVDANVFQRQVINTPQRHSCNNIPHFDSIFNKAEMIDTLYCLRMWFGFDLDEIQWKILQEDVSLNGISSSIPSSSPIKRYVHILVFDSTLVTETTAAKICVKCTQLGIHLLDIDLCEVIPILLEEYCYVTSMKILLLQYAKERLQCLFAFYLNHVAFFDFNVRLKMPIHQMLEQSRILYDNCSKYMNNEDFIPQTTINSCLLSTVNNSEDIGDILTDAFVNVRLNEKDNRLVRGFATIEHLYNLYLTDMLYLHSEYGVNLINDYVIRCKNKYCFSKLLGW